MRRILILTLLAGAAAAQGTLEDYKRGQGLQAKSQGLVVNLAGTPNWIGESDHFWYSRSVKGGTEFVLVDATAAAKKPAFDHDKLAAAINSATGGHYTGLDPALRPRARGRGGGAGRGAADPAGALTFSDNETTIQFGAAGFLWKCDLYRLHLHQGRRDSRRLPAAADAAPNTLR